MSPDLRQRHLISGAFPFYSTIQLIRFSLRRPPSWLPPNLLAAASTACALTVSVILQMSCRGTGRDRGSGRGSSSTPGASSSTQPAHSLDDDIHQMSPEEDLGDIVNDGLDLPFLSPDGLCLTTTLSRNCSRPPYSAASTLLPPRGILPPKTSRLGGGKHLGFHSSHESMCYTAFKEYAVNRVRDYVYRARTVPSARHWMSPEINREFDQWITSPEFKETSKQKKKNRASGSGEERKCSGTHPMGRRNFVDFHRSMDNNRDVPLSVPYLVISSKKKKSGSFVSRRFEQIRDVFTAKKAKALETQPDTPVDESRLYYETAGAYDKKGRVFGMGSAASMYYDMPASSRHSSAETYYPGIVSRLTQDLARDRQIHAETQARVEQLERETA